MRFLGETTFWISVKTLMRDFKLLVKTFGFILHPPILIVRCIHKVYFKITKKKLTALKCLQFEE